MAENPLLKLETYGQSIWIDYIRRNLLTSGELKRMIDACGVRGVTSNPSIFEKAVSGSQDYDEQIRSLALMGKSAAEIYEAVTVSDVQGTADVLRPLYDRLQGKDGFISLEVSPHLTHDTPGTIAEARRLWSKVNRPNAFIKVPATDEGIPAIRQLLSEGINVNITLLFGLNRYAQVAEAYLAGLEARAAQGEPVDRLASVASFFLSRIDVLVDPILEKKMQAGGAEAKLAEALHGQVAIACAKIAYQRYRGIFGSERLKNLAAKGARTQRVLWASTSTKNPAYSDVKYVEPLIGPDTINTVPQETLEAYADHGNPASRLEEGVPEAEDVLRRLPELGIDLDAVAHQLEEEGAEKFIKPYDALMRTLEEKRAELEQSAAQLRAAA